MHGTARRRPAWRLEGLSANRIHTVDLLIDSNLDSLLDAIRPRTVFNCVAYGGYSFETESSLIYQTKLRPDDSAPAPAGAAIDCLLCPCRQLFGIRRQCGGARRRCEDRPEQRLRCVEGRDRQSDLLLRPAPWFAIREPQAVFGVRPPRGLVAARAQPRALWPGGKIFPICPAGGSRGISFTSTT